MASARRRGHRRHRVLVLRIGAALVLLTIVVGVVAIAVRGVVSTKLLTADRVSIAIRSDPVLYLQIDRRADTIVAVSVPADAYIQVPRGYGSYRLGSVWELGNLEQIGGGVLLSETIQELLATPVTVWIAFGDSALHGETDELISQMTSRLFAGFGKDSVTTNLSLLDRGLLGLRLLTTPKEEIEQLNLADTDALSAFELGDGTESVSVDVERADVFTQGLFEYPGIREEGFTVEVLNATDQTGLGRRAVRFIAALGARVPRVANNPAPQQACRLRVNAGAVDSQTTRVIANIFDCRVEQVQQELREDIQVIVGLDYAEKLFKRVEQD